MTAVSDLGPIEEKFRAFGWHVRRDDGHDPRVLDRVFAEFRDVVDRPKAFIADTIKGKGVSFMHGVARGDETYRFHAGAPSLPDYLAATEELRARIDGRLTALGLEPLALSTAPPPVRVGPSRPEKLP